MSWKLEKIAINSDFFMPYWLEWFIWETYGWIKWDCI